MGGGGERKKGLEKGGWKGMGKGGKGLEKGWKEIEKKGGGEHGDRY